MKLWFSIIERTKQQERIEQIDVEAVIYLTKSQVCCSGLSPIKLHCWGLPVLDSTTRRDGQIYATINTAGPE